MPGYLVNPEVGKSENASIFSEQDSRDINSAYDKAFYGFRFDASTGRLTVDEINDNTMLISLPEPDIINPLDYKTWIWSKYKISFGWNASKKTNMNMEML